MKSFQAIATDLDGTLLRSDGTVSTRTRAAVMAAEDSGLRFVIATGRPPRWIAPIVEQLGDRGLVICANGAAVYDPAEHRLVSCIELKAEVVLSLVDEILDAFPDALLGCEQGFEFSLDESFKQKNQSHPSVHKAAAIEQLLSQSGISASQVVAFGDMPNDLEMIRWAGHGVAVANADPLLKAAADEVTASNDEDGVAVVIERLLG